MQGRARAGAVRRPQPPDPRRNAVGSRFDPSRPRIGHSCVHPPAGQHRAVCGRRRRTKASYAQDIGRSTLGRGDAPRRGTPHGPVATWADRHRPVRGAPAIDVPGRREELIGSARQRGSPSEPGGVSALDWIRTNDTRFRRAVLYPLSYEGLGEDYQRIDPPMTTRVTGRRRDERRWARRGGRGLRPGPTGWRCARCAAPPWPGAWGRPARGRRRETGRPGWWSPAGVRRSPRVHASQPR